MITPEMFKLMAERRFNEPRSLVHKPARTTGPIVAAIHRMLDEGLDAETIAIRLGVTRAAVDYRKGKMKAVQIAVKP